MIESKNSGSVLLLSENKLKRIQNAVTLKLNLIPDTADEVLMNMYGTSEKELEDFLNNTYFEVSDYNQEMLDNVNNFLFTGNTKQEEGFYI